ncbi:MAG: cell division protein FtsH [Alphaproteobacteria bacterium CG_4_9_14_3_um_filter_47_13]|nr:MAG: cell division protein FtsH [Alphaproteobacteria bacterium CG_4_9_14_3_um_filter_47_13]
MKDQPPQKDKEPDSFKEKLARVKYSVLRNKFALSAGALILTGALLSNNDVDTAQEPEKLSYSQFYDKLTEEGDKSIKNAFITINEDNKPVIKGEFDDKTPYYTERPLTDSGLFDDLKNAKKDGKIESYDIIQPDPPNAVLGFAAAMLVPLVLLGGLMAGYLYYTKKGGKKMEPTLPQNNQTKFKDVAGADEAKEELIEIVDFLKAHKNGKTMANNLGGQCPTGVLFTGDPGNGKTLLARAVAGEAGVPFFAISGSDFVEMFVGVGASRVRNLFDQARKSSPCMIFIDEIDAVGKQRGHGLSRSSDEQEQTLNQLLVEMDGFNKDTGVIVMAATNRPDMLDSALTRPGRFDRKIIVPHPDIKAREQILNIHMKKIVIDPDLDIHEVAKGSIGMSGADLANLVNEAARTASRRNAEYVTLKDFEDTRDKIWMGAESKLVLSPEERRTTAYHEAGHAIALWVNNNKDLHKISIVPRGKALGVTMAIPETDKYSMHLQDLKNDLVMLYAGRMAEEYLYPGNPTTGADNDIERATGLARNMVTRWGMTWAGNKENKFGVVNYAPNSLTGAYAEKSQQTQEHIDQEVKNISIGAMEEAAKLIRDHEQEFTAIAEALLEHETLNRQQIEDAIAGRPIKSHKTEIKAGNDNSPEEKTGKALASQSTLSTPGM